MTPRERVLAAVNHSNPDRIPTALWGSAYGITDPLYFELLRYFDLGDPVSPFRPRKGHTINYYDDRVLDALGIDVRHASCGFTDLGGPSAGGGEDSWGVRYDQKGLYLTAVSSPLENADIEDLQAYQWPEAERLIYRDTFAKRVRYLKEETDYAVVGRAYDSFGPFERCCSLRSTQNFLIDLGINVDFARTLIEKITDVHLRLLEEYLDLAGPWLDIIELPGDDYAAAQPIISPQMFDDFFRPAWKRIIELIKEKSPGVKILFHSDGNMEPFLGRLIDLGVDIFHCLEPLPTVDISAVKSDYGRELCFWGAIDIKESLQKDRESVVNEVKRRIRVLGDGGGYVLAPANHLQPDVPAENVDVLFEAAREFGNYPLDFEKLSD
jgi:uroporphyrinogen decarboxylase